MPEDYDPHSINAVLSRIDTNIEKLLEGQKDLNSRVSSLERWKWGIMGGAAVIAFAFRAAWEWITGGQKH